MTRGDDDHCSLMPIRWSDRAIADLNAISDFISQDNPPAATHLIEQIFTDVERAGRHPCIGRVVPELERDDVRELLRGRYRIVYQRYREEIVVLTVFEGHRCFPGLAI